MDTKDLWKGFTLKGSEDKAVFLIHGFTGTCAEMYPPAEYLNKAGYTCIVPFMVGNTLSMEDLKKTNYQDWLNSILVEYRKARKQYKTLYVLGLSMGGGMSLIIDEEEKDKPDGIVLYEPCITIKNKAAYCAGFLKLFVKKLTFGPAELPKETEPYFVGPNGYYTEALNDLVKVSNMAKKNLSKVSSPFLCFYSLKDEMITFSGIKKLIKESKSKNKNLHILSTSPHMIQILDSRQEVFKITLDFLASLDAK